MEVPVILICYAHLDCSELFPAFGWGRVYWHILVGVVKFDRLPLTPLTRWRCVVNCTLKGGVCLFLEYVTSRKLTKQMKNGVPSNWLHGLYRNNFTTHFSLQSPGVVHTMCAQSTEEQCCHSLTHLLYSVSNDHKQLETTPNSFLRCAQHLRIHEQSHPSLTIANIN